MELELIAVIITICVGLVTLLKPVRAYITKLWRKSFGKRDILLQEILAELKPNGGTSLRDAVDKILLRNDETDAFDTAQLNIFDTPAFKTNQVGAWLYVNRAFTKLTGTTLGENLGQGWINTVDPKERGEFLEKWNAAVSAQREFSEDVQLLVGPAHVNAYKAVDTKGRLRGYLGVVTVL